MKSVVRLGIGNTLHLDINISWQYVNFVKLETNGSQNTFNKKTDIPRVQNLSKICMYMSYEGI